ncbi:MAG: hypothetical protein HY869_18870 [Chloroflexi bacterium]|nr:hypothetical protein [Chloroflexota bacterium]
MATKRSTRLSVRQRGSVAPQVEFAPDYTHVKHDLTRIGILAGSFFAILIVLSFFLK